MIVEGTIASAKDRYERWLQTPSDIRDHLPLLKSLSHGNVLEIGVRSGVSTSALLYGITQRGGHLWSVDIEDCSCVFKGHPQWSFIHADSLDTQTVLAHIPEHLDLLLVDGDHDYLHCYGDLTTYGPRADVIAVHDTDTTQWPDVPMAVADFYERHPLHIDMELIHGCNGMAIMRKHYDTSRS